MITPGYSLTATERVLPRLALDFTTGSLDARVSLTRALNTATRVNSSGYIETVNANLPRFTYDPVSKANKGLLIEETRQNLFSYASDFGNAIWLKGAVSANATSTKSPDGTVNAYKIVANTSNVNHGIFRDVTPTAATHTVSFYAKAAEYSLVRIADAGNGDFRVSFNLATGQVVAGSSGGARYITARVDPDVDSWYRCSVVFTGTGSIIYPLIGGYPAGATLTAFGVTYAGDNTSGVHLYGVQVETGAFASSFIPTTTTSLTRNADVVSMTGANFSSWYNTSEGTMLFEYDIPTYLTAPALGGIGQNTYDTTARFNVLSAIRADGASFPTPVTCGTVVTGTGKLAAALKENDYAAYVNGAVNGTDTTGTMIPSASDRFNIGWDEATDNTFLNACIRKIQYYPLRLQDAQLAAISK